MKAAILTLIALFTYQLGNSQCQIKTKAVTIFKDATVFVEKEGICQPQNNYLTIENADLFSPTTNSSPTTYNQRGTPAKNHIILGTLDVHCPDNKIVSISSKKSRKKNLIHSIRPLLQKNRGKTIRLNLKDKTVVTGVIYSLETKDLFSKDRAIYFLILKIGNKWRIINLAEVQDFEFVDEPELHTDSYTKSLALKLQKNKKEQAVQLSYLQKGITWIPNYLINIKDEKTLDLTLSANILNDIEDLQGVDINLVVGIPVFKFSSVEEPIFSSQNVIQTIAQLNSSGQQRDTRLTMSNHITSQRLSNQRESYGNNTQPVIEGQNNGDLFFYDFKDVSLNKGERLNLEILSTSCPYKTVYVTELPTTKTNNGRIYENQSEVNYVWRSLSFKNNTQSPYTTGTVFFKKQFEDKQKQMPISQSELSYAPANFNCVVKMNVSPNITVSTTDEEVDRIENEREYEDLITVEAKIEINNFKNEAVEMIINRAIIGNLTSEPTSNFRILNTNRNLNDSNQKQRVEWKILVPPNKKKLITYQYQIYEN